MGCNVHLLLLLELWIVSATLAAFYKDLKFLCLECSCDREQLLSDGVIDTLEVQCEEDPHPRGLPRGPPRPGALDERKLLVVEADQVVPPERVIHNVDLLIQGLNLTSVDALNHLKKAETPVAYRKVSLATNAIESLPEDFSTGLETVKFLDVSSNLLARIEHAAFESLEFLQVLNLSRNALSRLDLNVLEHSPLLEEVDLSQNKLNKLWCEKLELKRLKILDLSSNFLFGSVVCSLPSPGEPVLENVTTSDVTSLDALWLPELTHLNLSRNQMDAVTAATFAGMPRLRVLDLSANRLVSFRFEPPRALDGLEDLFLASNRIAGIAGSFLSLKNLELTRNEVKRLDEVVAQKLARLDVSHNQLSSLEAVLKVSPKLEDLDASWNNITTINCFEFYGELKNLMLDGNPLMGDRLNISGFHKLTFLSLNFVPTLENFHTSSLASVFDPMIMLDCAVLNMSHNPELSSIIGTFADKNLCQVDLSNNKLTTVEQSAFNWNKVKTIDLQGNPFDCRCSLKWMVDFLLPFLMKSSPSLLSDLSCASPEEYEGKRLVHWYKRQDFCNSSRSSLARGRSMPFLTQAAGVAPGLGVALGEPEPEAPSAAAIIQDHKLLIAGVLLAAIVLVVVAIGCVLLRKHKTRRRKEHIKRNRRYPDNKFGL
nr:PREDICTED: leucine-rich repeats and immunoglobulin-like domains protein sma-10 [Bemisia tabaci]XP_018915609.1 PREDICTED: leucine-rich repeats and immunoglobulin-like domains protein sma-10 [Bemisia tabaci]